MLAPRPLSQISRKMSRVKERAIIKGKWPGRAGAKVRNSIFAFSHSSFCHLARLTAGRRLAGTPSPASAAVLRPCLAPNRNKAPDARPVAPSCSSVRVQQAGDVEENEFKEWQEEVRLETQVSEQH